MLEICRSSDESFHQTLWYRAYGVSQKKKQHRSYTLSSSNLTHVHVEGDSQRPTEHRGRYKDSFAAQHTPWPFLGIKALEVLEAKI